MTLLHNTYTITTELWIGGIYDSSSKTFTPGTSMCLQDPTQKLVFSLLNPDTAKSTMFPSYPGPDRGFPVGGRQPRWRSLTSDVGTFR